MLIYECRYCGSINNIKNERCHACGAPASLTPNANPTHVKDNIYKVDDTIPHQIASLILLVDPTIFDPVFE